MPLTLEQQREVPTDEQVLDEDLIPVLTELGFDSTAWQSGSKERDFLTGVAHGYVLAAGRRAAMSYMLYNQDAEGLALEQLSLSHFANERIAARATERPVTFTGGDTPWTVAAGDVVCSTTDGVQFRNTAGGTIPAGGSVSLACRAEVAGTAGNVAAGTITTMVTTFAGVTCTNPATITVVGLDQETEPVLRLRNSSKWATLSTVTSISARWENVARGAVTNCRIRVRDDNPGGAGTVWLYLASDTGVATGAQVTAVQTAVDEQKFGARPVYAAPACPFTLTATVYYLGTSPQTAVEAALTAYVNAAPIGGYDVDTRTNIIPFDDLVQCIRGASPYVRSLVISSPAADVPVTPWTVATITLDLTYLPA